MKKFFRIFLIISLLLLGSKMIDSNRVPTSAILQSVTYKKFSSWGVQSKKDGSINLADAYSLFEKNKDVVVAVIDTGVDPYHPFLKDNVLKLRGDKSRFGIDVSKDKTTGFAPMDTHGHGTHVAGIVKSVYPGVKLLIIKYYSRRATGKENLNAALEAFKVAIRYKVDIINFSGGGKKANFIEKKIMKEAEDKGILVVAAAGNESSDIDTDRDNFYPAEYDLSNIISVTAHNKSLKVLPSSNYGENSVDIAAPGNRIKSAFPYGRSVYLTGTSQATGFVTGVAALLKAQYPKLKPHEIKELIMKSGKVEKTLESKVAGGKRLDAFTTLENAQRIYGKVRSFLFRISAK